MVSPKIIWNKSLNTGGKKQLYTQSSTQSFQVYLEVIRGDIVIWGDHRGDHFIYLFTSEITHVALVKCQEYL